MKSKRNQRCTSLAVWRMLSGGGKCARTSDDSGCDPHKSFELSGVFPLFLLPTQHSQPTNHHLEALDSIHRHHYHIVEEYVALWLPLGSEPLEGSSKGGPSSVFTSSIQSRPRRYLLFRVLDSTRALQSSLRNCSIIQPNQHSTVLIDSSATIPHLQGQKLYPLTPIPHSSQPHTYG